MHKILVVITTGFVPWGGLTTVMMNYYRAMDKTGMRIDFVSCNAAPSSLIDELSLNGSWYIQLSDRKKHTVRYVRDLCKILRHEQYDVIHIHGNSATMLIELLPAWILGIKRRIVHVHTTKNSHRLAHAAMKVPMNLLANMRLAVSEEAGHYLYVSRKFTIMRNAIDTARYQFNHDSRLRCRREWGISDSAYVIGTVGKMYEPKNQIFLVEVFAKVLDRLPDAKLLLVGDGILRRKIEDRIKVLGIENACILTGMQEDAADFLCAMDCFVFPSIWEGLPLALLEAQANGLPCVVSDTVAKEAAMLDNIKFLHLDDFGGWIDELLYKSNAEREDNEVVQKKFAEKGYDITINANVLRECYFSGGNFVYDT